MSSTEIALFTSDDRLPERITELLGDDLELRTLRTAESVLAAIAPQRTRGLFADLTRVTGGGHAEVRLLEAVRQLAPEMPIQLLATASLPETIERWLACTPNVRKTGAFDASSFAEFVSRPAADVVADLVHVPHAAPVENREPTTDRKKVAAAPPTARTVLAGISRQFETDSLEMTAILEDLEIAARHDVTILLIGETGSGKTFLSRLIHEVSPRCDEPFLHVACEALPAELIESELFGHVKGSFTSAHADKEGKFAAAGRGTILLDEIDVLTPEQQVKLLRVIETGEFEPVGSNKTIKTQARLVVASNLDLEPLVEQGKFRPDLYYRLNMLKFDVLPLRDRRTDIVPLAEKFIRQQTAKHGIEVRETRPELFAALLAYPWPGNVRELENVIQRAVIYCRDGVLAVRQLPPHVVAGHAGPTNDAGVQLRTDAPQRNMLNARVAVTEREIIEQALVRHRNNKTDAARDLGISRVTLYNKIKKYGVPL